jgi:hypothetical protein
VFRVPEMRVAIHDHMSLMVGGIWTLPALGDGVVSRMVDRDWEGAAD